MDDKENPSMLELCKIYLRTLVKSDRQKISPMSSYIKDFTARWNSGKIFNERSLGEALADRKSVV